MKWLIFILIFFACNSQELEILKEDQERSDSVICLLKQDIQIVQDKNTFLESKIDSTENIINILRRRFRWGIYDPASVGDTGYLAIYSDSNLRRYRIGKIYPYIPDTICIDSCFFRNINVYGNYFICNGDTFSIDEIIQGLLNAGLK